MFLELLVLFFITVVCYYLYIYKKNHYAFEAKGLKYLPGVPAFGNFWKGFIGWHHLWEDCDDIYKAFPDEKYVGFVDGKTPGIFVRDPEIIKNITVKDFDHFMNHKEFFPERDTSLISNSILMMKDEKWRQMRTTLTPAFTSSKLRQLLPFMKVVSKNITEYLKEHESEDIDVYDLMCRYSNDVIASAGFGIQINSLKDRSNPLYEAGLGLFTFNLGQTLRMLFATQFPSLSKKLGLEVIPKSTSGLFQNIFSDAVEYRTKNNIERPDMIQLLIHVAKGTLNNNNETPKTEIDTKETTSDATASKKKPREWTEMELAAQVFTFFFAGFETTGNTVINCIHELALNPDVQDKLYNEIKSFHDKNGEPAFEQLSELTYLEGVLNETMRKWAPAVIMDRICTKPYELPPPREGGKPCKVNPGDLIFNTVNSLHMDPKYYPDPEKFDPERFSDKNKHLIKPFTFAPFGAGPRVCIGQRFAYAELKIVMFHLILNFKILKCAKTLDPIRMTPRTFSMKVYGGTLVRFQSRV